MVCRPVTELKNKPLKRHIWLFPSECIQEVAFFLQVSLFMLKNFPPYFCFSHHGYFYAPVTLSKGHFWKSRLFKREKNESEAQTLLFPRRVSSAPSASVIFSIPTCGF